MSITAGDIAYLQSCYPRAAITPLTAQQEQFVLYILRGMAPTQAARGAGYKSPSSTAGQLMQMDKIQAVLAHLRSEEMDSIKVTRDQLTLMLFEAHRKSATATEEITAVRELGKMHGLYEPDKVQTQNLHLHKVEQLERMDEDDLVKLAGADDFHLPPAENHLPPPDAQLPSPETHDSTNEAL